MFADVVDQLMGLDDAQITARFRDLELRRRRDEAELLALVAVAHARGVHAADGHRTTKSWLRANANWSPGEAASACRKARVVNDHPSVGDALLDGHLGVAQVAELARVRANPRCGDDLGEVIDQLVDYGEQLDYVRFCKVVKRWEHLADQDGALTTTRSCPMPGARRRSIRPPTVGSRCVRRVETRSRRGGS